METDIANTTMAKAKASLITSGIREKFGTVGTGSLEKRTENCLHFTTVKPVQSETCVIYFCACVFRH